MNLYHREALRIMRLHNIHERPLEETQAHALVTVGMIITETLECHTNDENHDRVMHYQEVKKELENIFNT